MSTIDAKEEDLEMSNRKLLKEDEAVENHGGAPSKGMRKKIVDAACICLNIASTVTLIFLNKWYICRCTGSLKSTNTDRVLAQDIPRPPTREHANLLRNVALHLHIHRPLHSQQTPLQPLRPNPPTIPPIATPLQLLRRLPHTRKLKLGI